MLLTLLARLLGRRRPARGVFPPGQDLAGLDAASLRDIGLAPGDLPAVKSGHFFNDPTRRQR